MATLVFKFHDCNPIVEVQVKVPLLTQFFAIFKVAPARNSLPEVMLREFKTVKFALVFTVLPCRFTPFPPDTVRLKKPSLAEVPNVAISKGYPPTVEDEPPNITVWPPDGVNPTPEPLE